MAKSVREQDRWTYDHTERACHPDEPWVTVAPAENIVNPHFEAGDPEAFWFVKVVKGVPFKVRVFIEDGELKLMATGCTIEILPYAANSIMVRKGRGWPRRRKK